VSLRLGITWDDRSRRDRSLPHWAAFRGARRGAGRDRSRSVLRDAAGRPGRGGHQGGPPGRIVDADLADERHHQPGQGADRGRPQAPARCRGRAAARGPVRRADRGVPARRRRAARRRPGRLLGAQPGAGLRADDRLGTGRAAGLRGRPRHRVHRGHRGAARGWPGGRTAAGAGELSRRLRRRVDVPGPRRGGGAALRPRLRAGAGGRRRDRRRRRGAAGDDLRVARGRLVDRPAGRQPARHRRPVLRRVRDGRRAAHGGRRARVAVLRGVHPAAVRAGGGAGRSPRPARPVAVAGNAVAVRRAFPRTLPGRMVKGIRRNGRVRCPDPQHDRGPGRPAPGRAGHVRAHRRPGSARPGAAVQRRSGRRPGQRPPGRVDRAGRREYPRRADRFRLRRRG
jgi:hypothetical protein